MAEGATPVSPPAIQWTDGGWRAHALFAAVALLLSGAIPFHPADLCVAPPFGDTASTLWNFWIVDGMLRGAPLGTTPLVFHPLGGNLAYHTMEWLPALLTQPLRMLAGANVQHASALIAATYLTAWWTWLAARQWGAAVAGAAAAGIAVGLHSYRLVEGIHLNLFNTQFFPLALYLLGRLRANPRDTAAACWLGATAAGVLYTSLFHALGCALLGAGVGCWLLWRSPDRRALALRLAIPAVVGAFAALPIMLAMSRAPATASFGAESMARNAADVWQWLLPPPRLRLALTGVDESLAEAYGAGHARAFVWYLPGWILGGFALASLRCRGPHCVLIGAAFFFAMLSLGPALKLGSPAEVNPAGGMPLPTALLFKLPGIGTVRSVWHFGFLATMLLAISGGIAAGECIGRLAAERRRLAAVALCTIALAEVYVGALRSYPVPDTRIAARIRESLAPGEALVAVPNEFYEVRAHFLYQQTQHGRAMNTGYLSRDPLAWEEWRQSRVWPAELEDLYFGRRAQLSPMGESRLRHDIIELNFRGVLLYDPTENGRMAEGVVREMARLGLGTTPASEGGLTFFTIQFRP